MSVDDILEQLMNAKEDGDGNYIDKETAKSQIEALILEAQLDVLKYLVALPPNELTQDHIMSLIKDYKTAQLKEQTNE